MHRKMVAIFLLAGMFSPAVWAWQNIHPDHRQAWSENIGWTNWRDADDAMAGVGVGDMFLSGYIWSENAGWINVGDGTPVDGVNYANLDGGDFGINVDPDGDLHGLAWGENIGWVNFDGGAMATPSLPARIECVPGPNGETLSRLTGYAWGENVGWLNLNDMMHFVSVDAATTPIECDMDHNSVVNGLDIQFFVDFMLMNSAPGWRDVCSGDLEMLPDGTLDVDDVTGFVACLLNA
ncbi:MAG: hypothetical protein MI923_28770 [Phycisphaerales bacterium]|nr:hypothetical protein [Phycisphaerales bacterium]